MFILKPQPVERSCFMKRLFLLFFSLICVLFQARGHGSFYFANWDINSPTVAPIYGPEPANPHQQKWGNALDAIPPGSQTYTGTKLAGPNYSVEARYSLAPVSDIFALNSGASPVSGSLTTFYAGGAAGFFEAGTLVIPDVPSAGSPGVSLQVHAWDNAGDRYHAWEGAGNAARAGRGRAVGWSKVFWQPVAFGTFPPPGLYNIE